MPKFERRIEGLSEKAVEVLANLLDDPSPTVRLAAAKEILDRRYGKSREPVDVRSTVVDHGAADLGALRELAERGLGQTIEAKAN